jgi:hypothetical protein
MSDTTPLSVSLKDSLNWILAWGNVGGFVCKFEINTPLSPQRDGKQSNQVEPTDVHSTDLNRGKAESTHSETEHVETAGFPLRDCFGYVELDVDKFKVFPPRFPHACPISSDPTRSHLKEMTSNRRLHGFCELSRSSRTRSVTRGRMAS